MKVMLREDQEQRVVFAFGGLELKRGVEREIPESNRAEAERHPLLIIVPEAEPEPEPKAKKPRKGKAAEPAAPEPEPQDDEPEAE